MWCPFFQTEASSSVEVFGNGKHQPTSTTNERTKGRKVPPWQLPPVHFRVVRFSICLVERHLIFSQFVCLVPFLPYIHLSINTVGRTVRQYLQSHSLLLPANLAVILPPVQYLCKEVVFGQINPFLPKQLHYLRLIMRLSWHK